MREVREEIWRRSSEISRRRREVVEEGRGGEGENEREGSDSIPSLLCEGCFLKVCSPRFFVDPLLLKNPFTPPTAGAVSSKPNPTKFSNFAHDPSGEEYLTWSPAGEGVVVSRRLRVSSRNSLWRSARARFDWEILREAARSS